MGGVSEKEREGCVNRRSGCVIRIGSRLKKGIQRCRNGRRGGRRF